MEKLKFLLKWIKLEILVNKLFRLLNWIKRFNLSVDIFWTIYFDWLSIWILKFAFEMNQIGFLVNQLWWNVDLLIFRLESDGTHTSIDTRRMEGDKRLWVLFLLLISPHFRGIIQIFSPNKSPGSHNLGGLSVGYSSAICQFHEFAIKRNQSRLQPFLETCQKKKNKKEIGSYLRWNWQSRFRWMTSSTRWRHQFK